MDALTDADIEHAVAEDADAAPLLDADWFRTATLLMPPVGGEDAVALRIDRDVLEWFKATGRGYPSRMNAVLRAYFEHERGNTNTVRPPAGSGVRRVTANPDVKDTLRATRDDATETGGTRGASPAKGRKRG